MSTPDYDLIRRWEAALRSGEYKQMKGALKAKAKTASDFSHCSMGVLCEVAGLDGEVRDLDVRDEYVGGVLDAVHFGPDDDGTLNAATMLPGSVLSRLLGTDSVQAEHADSDDLDLRLKIPEHIRDSYPNSLSWFGISDNTIVPATELNDDIGLTFDQIAECIRFTWPEAFESEA